MTASTQLPPAQRPTSIGSDGKRFVLRITSTIHLQGEGEGNLLGKALAAITSGRKRESARALALFVSVGKNVRVCVRACADWGKISSWGGSRMCCQRRRSQLQAFKSAGTEAIHSYRIHTFKTDVGRPLKRKRES